jgi:hypothetical protein
MSTKIKILHRFSLQGKELSRDEQLIVSDSQAKHWTEQGLVEVIEKGDFPETGQELNINFEKEFGGNTFKKRKQPAPKPTTKKATKKK